jgi:tetratricopeptide (TPR) repeat protein
LAPDDPDALNAMGLVRFEQQNSDEALTLFRRAVAVKPQLADAHNNIGNILKENGEGAAARAAFERAIALDPREIAYYANLSEAKRFIAGDPHLAAMEELARKSETLLPVQRSQLNFALAKAYDDLGRFDAAFACMRQGNALKRQRIAYDEVAVLGFFDRVRAVFARTLLELCSESRCDAVLPIFIVGMPRSGTTLVEQILASHPAVHGAGELRDLDLLVGHMRGAGGNAFRYPEDTPALKSEQLRELGEAYVDGLRRRAPQAARVTDKMPGNFFYLGLVHLVLPSAPIIHVRRDPRDTCLSCYSKLFSAEQNFAYDLGELGRYYARYAQLMAHWRDVLPPGRVFDIRYEDVVTDLEGSARRIVEHCGLDWHPACLAFHEARRPVRTASASQVRRPIYRTSEGRWRAYEKYLGPLLAALGDALTPGSAQAVPSGK